MKNTFKTLDEIERYCADVNAKIGFSENTDVYRKRHVIGGLSIRNSLAVLPMEGADAKENGAPGEMTRRRYQNFGKGGAGIVWYEAIAVAEEGRASARQMRIHEGNADAFKRMTDEVREQSVRHNGYAPIMVIQLTHSGRYSKPGGMPVPVISAHNPVLDHKFGIPSDYKPVSDEALAKLEDKFVEAALLAEKAGFDAVDIKASHGYLLGELLGAHMREGLYGGDFEGRTRLVRNVAAKMRQALKPEITLAIRLSLYDALEPEYGFGVGVDGLPDLTEPVKLLCRLRGLGVTLCAVTAGNPYLMPHINRPFDNGAYTPPEPPVKGVERLLFLAAAAKRMVPEMSFIGAGYSWLKSFAVQGGAYTLENGHADFIGFGRQAFANPNFANDILNNGRIEANKTCVACTKCVELMRATLPSGCVVRDKTYADLYQRHIMNKG